VSAVKHQPATPLPWIVVKDGIYTVIDSKPPNAKRVGVMKYIDAPADQNAAYVAHSANAYPKLIEALQRMARTPAAYPAADRAAAFQLLGELGEAA
jgi:hypothetical protein